MTWTEAPKRLLGPWAVRYFPGEEVWTHLVRNSDDGTYRTLWWNARGKQIRPPETTALPTEPGETVQAKPQ